jgi:hypothetical protein
LVALGVASGLTLATSTALGALHWLKAAGTTALGVFGSQWGAGILISMVAVGAVSFHVTQQKSEGEHPTITTPAPRYLPSTIPLSIPSSIASSLEPETGAGPPVVDEPSPAQVVAPTPPSVASPPSPVSRNPAISEIELLDLARQRLRAGDAEGALSALGERQHRYPGGSLVTEARVLRIEALAASGRAAQASSEARNFLQQHPNGLLSHRVRRWLERREAR